MSEATIKEALGSITFTWDKPHLIANVTQLRPNIREGTIWGRLNFTSDAPGYKGHLWMGRLNFDSPTTRKQIVSQLKDQWPDFDWFSVFEFICYHVSEINRRGEPVIELDPTQEISPPKYLLHPILLLNQPTIIFGDAGAGKSELAILISMCVQLPWDDNPFRLTAPEKCANVLYLDYETEHEDVCWRLKCLLKGHDLPPFSINYRYCTLPLPDDIEQIQKAASDTKAGLIVVDSLGAACGGDLNSPEVALRFFTALRGLRLTSLILAHTSKDTLTKKKTPFGSMFFMAAARAVWECRNEVVPGESEMNVALLHRKINVARLSQPLGFTFTFLEDRTIARRKDVKDMPELREGLPVAKLILDLLRGGAMTTQELADALDKTIDNIRTVCNRLKYRDQITQPTKGTWGLLAHDEEYP